MEQKQDFTESWRYVSSSVSTQIHHQSNYRIQNSDIRRHSVNGYQWNNTSRSDRMRIGPVNSKPSGEKSTEDDDVRTTVLNLLSQRPPPPSYLVTISNSIGNNSFSFKGVNPPPVIKQQHVIQRLFEPEKKRKAKEFKGFSDDDGGKKRKNLNLKLLTQSKKLLSPDIKEISPELYTHYNAFPNIEQKLDNYFHRKSLEFERILQKPPLKTKKLRIFVITKVSPGTESSLYPLVQEAAPPSWELVVEGKFIDQFGSVDDSNSRDFSTFLQSLSIMLDEKLYGPQDHIFEWTRYCGVKETKGFCINRLGSKNVKYSVSLQLKNDSLMYKWNKNLADLLGLNAQNQYSKDTICHYLWQYIKSNSLQDATQNEYINLDEKLKLIFRTDRILFRDIPLKLPYLMICPPPVVINDTIRLEQGEGNKTIHLDLDIDLEDSELLSPMKEFLEKTKAMENSEAMKKLDNKLDTVLSEIHKSRLVRDFHLQFQNNPQKSILKWLQVNTGNLKIMTEIKGNPEEERKSEFYNQTWTEEAVARYLSSQETSRKLDEIIQSNSN